MNKQDIEGILDTYNQMGCDLYYDQAHALPYLNDCNVFSFQAISPPQSFYIDNNNEQPPPLHMVDSPVVDPQLQQQVFQQTPQLQQQPIVNNEPVFKYNNAISTVKSNQSSSGSVKSGGSANVFRVDKHQISNSKMAKSQSFQVQNQNDINQINLSVQSSYPANQSLENSQNLSDGSSGSFNRNIHQCQLGHSALDHDNEDSFNQQKSYDNEANNKKKRGRRKLEDNQYYAITNDKIQEWEYMLQNSKNLSKKEKKILRNRISAQKSRNKKKEEFGTLNQQLDQLKSKYSEIFDIIEEQLCDQCKQAIFNALNQGQPKRQKSTTKQVQTSVYSKSGLIKLMAAFIGLVGIVAVIANSLDLSQPQFLFASDQTSNSPRLLEAASPQNYIVLQVNTLTQKSFNIMGMIDEKVIDIKNRIQQIEGIPIASQRIYFNGQELANTKGISNLGDGDKIFLIIAPNAKGHKVQTHLKSNNQRYLDDSLIDVYVSYESSEPIKFRQLKEIWDQSIGLHYLEHYIITIDGQIVDNDDHIISDDTSCGDYELQLITSPQSAIQSTNFYSQPENQNFLQKLMKITTNEILLEENMHVYRMKINHDINHDNIFDVQTVNWQQRNDRKMFIIDNDEDPVNDPMILFQKTEFNKFQLSSINCKETQLIPDLEQHNHLHLIIPKNYSENQLNHSNLPEFDCVIQPIHDEL